MDPLSIHPPLKTSSGSTTLHSLKQNSDSAKKTDLLLSVLEPLCANIDPATFALLYATHNRELNTLLAHHADPLFAAQECVRHLKAADYRRNELKYTLVDVHGRHAFPHVRPVYRRGEQWTSMQYYSEWMAFTKLVEPRPYMVLITREVGDGWTMFTHCTEAYRRASREPCYCRVCRGRTHIDSLLENMIFSLEM